MSEGYQGRLIKFKHRGNAMKLINIISEIMDRLETAFESAGARAMTGTFLVGAFLFGLLSVEMNIRGLAPDFISVYIPVKHLVIIAQTFNLILCFEVISLVFSFVHSVSISMGKQIEILSLVLLRDVFMEFSNFNEPIDWVQIKPFLLPMASSALGALALFILLGVYYRIHQSRPITVDADEAMTFIKIKKNIAFLLLISFIIIISYEAFRFIAAGQPNRAFETFYTLLIFSDILIILFSMRYNTNYLVTFRNSGFAAATVFMRLALLSPPVYSALIGVGTALFVLGLSVYYRQCTSIESCG